MRHITITKAQLSEILDGKYIRGGFEKHYRHNGGDQAIVFERDGKHYELCYRWFEDEGIDWQDTYEVLEVVAVETIVKVWKAAP